MHPLLKLNGHKVDDLQVDFNADETAYFSGAVWVDGPSAEEELDEEELEALGDTYPEELVEAELQRRIDMAEDWRARYTRYMAYGGKDEDEI